MDWRARDEVTLMELSGCHGISTRIILANSTIASFFSALTRWWCFKAAKWKLNPQTPLLKFVHANGRSTASKYHTSCDPPLPHRQPLQLHLQWNVNFASLGHPGCSAEHAFPLSCIRFAYPAQHCFSRAPTEALCLDISIYTAGHVVC
jgi:hypothetical protein